MVRFITFEGGEGTGKTTQVALLASYVSERARPCVVTREPGGTALGKMIRKTLLQVDDFAIAPATELFLYLADRAEHVHEVIAPALKAGKLVICDRFADSTLVYQGYGRGFDLAKLRHLNDLAVGDCRPQLSFLLDCPAELGLLRAAQRSRDSSENLNEDRFEREHLAFHEKIRQGFLQVARAEPNRFRILDAVQPVERVWQQVRQIIDRELF